MGSSVSNAVYYVQCENSEKMFDPIAIRPTLEEGYIEWEDTGMGFFINVKDRTLGEKLKKSPNVIQIKSKDGDLYTLTKMTVELFNEHVRNQAAGNPEFNSDEELQEYYLNTDFSGYP